MVAHQDIGMDDPAAFFAGLEEGSCKSCGRPLFAKQVFPVISPVGHMIDRALEFQTRLPCHHVTRPRVAQGTIFKL